MAGNYYLVAYIHVHTESKRMDQLTKVVRNYYLVVYMADWQLLLDGILHVESTWLTTVAGWKLLLLLDQLTN